MKLKKLIPILGTIILCFLGFMFYLSRELTVVPMRKIENDKNVSKTYCLYLPTVKCYRTRRLGFTRNWTKLNRIFS